MTSTHQVTLPGNQSESPEKTSLLRLARSSRRTGIIVQLTAVLTWSLFMPLARANYEPDSFGQPQWMGQDPAPEEGADWNDWDSDTLPTWIEIYLNTNPYMYDTDGDGLSDGDEYLTTGTSPIQWDTDFNGWSDYDDHYGYSNTTDSNDTSDSSDSSSDSSDTSEPPPPDSDSDGLSDNDEDNIYYTDSAIWDTDGDGLSDGEEVLLTQTNPLHWDTDGDGISDYDEYHGNSSTDTTTTDTSETSDSSDSSDSSDPLPPDSDGDGLPDEFELQTSLTNPSLYDTDGNGRSDYEDYYWPEPDSDGDGLTDQQEIQLGTDFQNPDNDNDGLTDGEEYFIFQTDPLNTYSVSQGNNWGNLYTDWQLVDLTDSDDGGIPDRVEQYYGMNPADDQDDLYGDLDGDNTVNIDQYNAGISLTANITVVYDHDNDGMTTVWENAHGLNPYDASDAGDDPDYDWITNLEEYQLGLNPVVWDDFQTVMGSALPTVVRGTGPNQGTADWDGDGVNNNDELLTHFTDPRVTEDNGGGGGGTTDTNETNDTTDEPDTTDSSWSTFTDDNDTSSATDTTDSTTDTTDQTDQSDSSDGTDTSTTADSNDTSESTDNNDTNDDDSIILRSEISIGGLTHEVTQKAGLNQSGQVAQEQPTTGGSFGATINFGSQNLTPNIRDANGNLSPIQGATATGAITITASLNTSNFTAEDKGDTYLVAIEPSIKLTGTLSSLSVKNSTGQPYNGSGIVTVTIDGITYEFAFGIPSSTQSSGNKNMPSHSGTLNKN